VVAKTKNLDGIAPKNIVTGKEQYSILDAPKTGSKTSGKESLDPSGKVTGDFVLPKESKKWYIWSRTPKSKTVTKSADQLVKTSVTQPISEETSQKKSKSKKADKLVTIDEIIEQKPLKPKHRLGLALTVSGLTLVVLFGLIGGGVYAHQAIYENKVFPGVSVWGEDVGGKSVAEVQQMITRKAKEYNIVIKGPDQDYKATVQDLGIIFNSDSMALSAYSRGRSDIVLDDLSTRVRLLMTEIKWKPFQQFIRSNDLAISPSYTVNQEKLAAYLAKVSENINIQAQDSQVTVTGGITQLKPAIFGRNVELDGLKSSVLANISGLSTEKVDVQIRVIKPAIVDNAAQEVMLQAQNVMSRPVVLTYQGTEYRPNQDTVGSWISFTKNTGDTKYTLVVDKAKMASYFSFLGSKINIASTQRLLRVENGVKQTEAVAGADGLLVNTNLLGDQVSATLPSQPSVRLEIPTYVDKFKTKYENVVIADWAKYIDINLTTQTMIACEQGGVNCKEWKVTTGKDGSNTPTGTHLVLGRNANFYMTGGTVGVDYYKVWVDQAIWFTSQGHAIHDASWRNGSFGGQDYHWNGSHGCINSPDDAANYIYNWATVGTPVVVHY
jgi:hypothetical protein